MASWQLYSEAELRVRRMEREAQRAAGRRVRALLAVPFMLGVGLAAYEITRPRPSWVLLCVAVVAMLPLLCTWRGWASL